MDRRDISHGVGNCLKKYHIKYNIVEPTFDHFIVLLYDIWARF